MSEKVLSITINKKSNVEKIFQEILCSSQENILSIQELNLIIERNVILPIEIYKSIQTKIQILINVIKLSIQIQKLNFLQDEGLFVIQQSIQQFPNLQQLTIFIGQNNYLQSIGIKQLINSLSSLQSLIKLEIVIMDQFFHREEESIQLWSGIYFLTNLEYLQLTFSIKTINEEDIFQLCDCFSLFKNLKILKIQFQNNSNVNWLQRLLSSIQNLVYLEELFLLFVNEDLMTQDDLCYLCTFFKELVNLKYLDFDSIFQHLYRMEKFELLMESMQSLKNLKSFTFLDKFSLIQQKNSQLALGKCLKTLNKLESLQLDFPSLFFYQEFLSDLSKSFTQMKYLKKLSIQRLNQNNQKYLCLILNSLKNLDSLEDLYLTIVHKSIFDANISLLIQQGFQYLTNLKQLDLYFQSYTGEGLNGYENIFGSLKYLQKLQNLSIKCSNLLFKQEIYQISNSLQHLNEIQELELQICFQFFLDSDNQSFTEGFKNLLNLKILKLEISLNKQEHLENFQYLLGGLKYLQNLTEIEINSSQLGIEVSQFGEIFLNLTNLKKITLSLNSEMYINSKFIHYLINMESLEALDFQSYFVINEIFSSEYVNSFSRLQSLKYLTLRTYSDNNNQNEIEFISQGIQLLPNIEILNLDFQTILDDNGSTYLKQCFQKLKILKQLDLQFIIRDKLTNQGIKELYEGISYLIELEKISLFINSLSLNFINCLKGLKQLIYLGSVKLQFQFPRNMLKKQNELQIEETDFDVEEDNQIPQTYKNQIMRIDLKVNNYQNRQLNYVEQYMKEIQYYRYLNTLNIRINGKQVEINKILNQLNKSLFYTKMLQTITIFISQQTIDEVDNIQKMIQSQNQQIHKNSTDANIEQYSPQNTLLEIEQSDQKIQIKDLMHLKSFSFQITNSTIVQDCFLSNQIRTNQNLEILAFKFAQSLQDNSLSSNLGSYISDLKRLQTLDLIVFINNTFGKDQIISFGKGLSNLQNLKFLSIEFNNENFEICQEGACAIGKGIQNLIKLKTLKIIIGENNNICTEGLASIAFSIQFLYQLQSINIQVQTGNNIGQSIIKLFGQSLLKLKQLEKFFIIIYLCESIEKYPDEFGQLFEKNTSDWMDVNLQNTDNNFLSLFEKGFYSFSIYFENDIKKSVIGNELDVLKQLPPNTFFNINIKFNCKQFDKYLLQFQNQIKQLLTKQLSILINQFCQIEDQISLILIPLQFLSNLKELTLRICKDNDLNQNHFNEIGIQLSKLNNLNKLKLHIDNQISTDILDYKIIIKHLSKQQQLRILQFLSDTVKINLIKIYIISKIKRLVSCSIL